jgi:hypothetical protein
MDGAMGMAGRLGSRRGGALEGGLGERDLDVVCRAVFHPCVIVRASRGAQEISLAEPRSQRGSGARVDRGTLPGQGFDAFGQRSRFSLPSRVAAGVGSGSLEDASGSDRISKPRIRSAGR